LWLEQNESEPKPEPKEEPLLPGSTEERLCLVEQFYVSGFESLSAQYTNK
jgi:hypothetical protein